MYIPYIETWPQVRYDDDEEEEHEYWPTHASSFICCCCLLLSEVRTCITFMTLCLCPQAMSLLLLPHNIPDSLKHLSTLVDDIWYYAGDRSTDVSGSYHPRSPHYSSHTFLSPFHHNPHNVRPASSQVTLPPPPSTT